MSVIRTGPWKNRIRLSRHDFIHNFFEYRLDLIIRHHFTDCEQLYDFVLPFHQIRVLFIFLIWILLIQSFVELQENWDYIFDKGNVRGVNYRQDIFIDYRNAHFLMVWIEQDLFNQSFLGLDELGHHWFRFHIFFKFIEFQGWEEKLENFKWQFWRIKYLSQYQNAKLKNYSWRSEFLYQCLAHFDKYLCHNFWVESQDSTEV